VFVSFWAAWCKYSQAEVEDLKALHSEAAGSDFAMVGVSFSKDREQFEEFIEEHELTWPQMHAEEGWSSEAARAFDVKGVPSHFLIDRDGEATLLPRGNPERTVELVLKALAGGRVTQAVAR
ncbi:MAG: peroxiredoxin family protein, partial [Planctomycetota bacterium]